MGRRSFSLLLLILVRVAGADTVRFLGDPMDSLETRVSVIEAAQKEIDYQVYATGPEDDPVTLNFMTLLYRAANDPLRPDLNVYIVLDGLAEKLKMKTLAAMGLTPEGQPNPRMHIRLFDQILVDPLLIDNRMHNKLLVADARYAIVGGRNTGADYFDLNCADAKENYLDTDVLVSKDPDSPDLGLNLDSLRLSPSQLAGLSAPETLQRYAHLFFTLDRLQVTEPVTLFGLSDREVRNSLQQILDQLARMTNSSGGLGGGSGSFVIFPFQNSDGSTSSANCADATPVEVALGRASAEQSLRNRGRIEGADVGPVTALFDPPDRPLQENRQDDISVRLQDVLEQEFSDAHLLTQGRSGENPQLILISPYVSLTNLMRQTLQDIESRILKINAVLASERKAPIHLELQVITNGDRNADERGAQICFDEQALPQYRDLGAQVWEYAGDLGAANPSMRTGRLHLKMYLINRSHVFVGSFNSDFRSSNLNLELGVSFDVSKKDRATTALRERVQAEIFERLKGYDEDQMRQILRGDEPEVGNVDLSKVRATAVDDPLFDLFCRQQ